MYIRAVFFFPIVLAVLLLIGALGTVLRRRYPGLVKEDHRSSFSAVQAAVLALLGLLLGFSFSMGVSRYDGRKTAEIAEANAIGTAFARTGSLPPDEAARQQQWMRLYLQARIEFYAAGTDWSAVRAAEHRGSSLEQTMVRSAEASMGTNRDAVSNGYLAALTAVGDAAESREAALENTIPALAWVLLLGMAAVSSLLVGFGLADWHPMLGVLPLVVAASLTLIWDLDHPRSGLIRVRQDSMQRLASTVFGAQ